MKREENEFERRHPEIAGPFIKAVEARVLELQGIKASKQGKRKKRR